MSEDKQQLAYIGRGQYEDGRAYRCGALVITLKGEPREFRCTSPVRPNQLQRITYGSSLEPHMYLEVMGKPLLNELQEPVTLFLVDDPVLLSLQDVAGQPLIYARRQGSKPKSGNSKQSGQSSALISAPAGDFDPVIIESTGDKEGDVAYACSILELAAQNLDILEPFERLKLAMEKVHKSKEMDKK